MDIITIIRHSDGRFTVTKTEDRGKPFISLETAEAYAKKLQDEADGPDHAEIVRHDLTKAASQEANGGG